MRFKHEPFAGLPAPFVDLVTEACRELLFVVVGVALRSQVERGDYYGEGLRLELGGSWTGPDGVLITSCCFDIDGCGALVELSLGMGAGSLVRALRSRPTKALPIWRGTGSSNPPRSTSESDAKLLPRVWSCLVRSDEATQAVSPHLGRFSCRQVILQPGASDASRRRRSQACRNRVTPSSPAQERRRRR